VLAENAQVTYVAYVSEQNLVPDPTGVPCRHPQVADLFDGPTDGRYSLKRSRANQ